MVIKKEILIKEYNSHKLLLDKIRHDVTLEKWKVLSKAYKLGKKIWGSHFTRERLAHDMDMPMSTTLRCLALDRANKKTWKLIKSGKISSFKAAMICLTKNHKSQDKVVDFVIHNNVSTYKIKSLNIHNDEDILLEKQRLACEEGYSRKSSAYYNFNNWITRGKIFILMKRDHLPKDKLEKLDEGIINLSEQLRIYINNNIDQEKEL